MSERSVFATLGATNHSSNQRQENDFYATDPIAIEKLLEIESFQDNVWECACGEGHLSKVLIAHGHNVRSTDLINRGFGQGGVDFLAHNEKYNGDICTNPPYKYAKEFVEHAINVVNDGCRVAMFLRLQFLEGKERRKLFERFPPKFIYVSSSRINCCRDGDFSDTQRRMSSAQPYAWFIWEKGFDGDTTVRWFN